MRRLFKVGADRHGSGGKVVIAWHPDGNFLATAGKNAVVQITDRHGDILDEISMSSSNSIISLAWDKDGEDREAKVIPVCRVGQEGLEKDGIFKDRERDQARGFPLLRRHHEFGDCDRVRPGGPRQGG